MTIQPARCAVTVVAAGTTTRWGPHNLRGECVRARRGLMIRGTAADGFTLPQARWLILVLLEGSKPVPPLYLFGPILQPLSNSRLLAVRFGVVPYPQPRLFSVTLARTTRPMLRGKGEGRWVIGQTIDKCQWALLSEGFVCLTVLFCIYVYT